MIHCPGTRTPNTEPLPEEARLDVFLPLFLLREYSGLAPFFARAVQQFAEEVATVTMKRWDRAKSLHAGGVLNDPTIPRTPSARATMKDLIPYSTTPQHVFYGRPIGEIDLLIAQLSPSQTRLSSASTSQPSSQSTSQPSSQSTSQPSSRSTTKPQREIIHVSPRGMPQLKVAYASDDPWRLEDALAWAEMWEAFPEPSQGEREPRAVIRALKAHIKDLESAIRTRDTAISELKDILGDDGELFLSSPPFIRLNHHSRQQDRARGFILGNRSVLRSSTDRHQSAR